MQAVCISNRPDDFRESLTYWEALVPWIDEVLLVCPGQVRDRMPSGSRIGTRILDETELLGSFAPVFRHSPDHQLKNLILRAGIAHCRDVDDVFLMFDDDHRPLGEIKIEDFVDETRHHNYYFYELDRWQATSSDFDRGQHNTFQTLHTRGLPTLAYASHMPQIIDKSILNEAFSEFDNEIANGTALDEWSLYFNYACNRYPDRFHQPRAFTTLCWPALPTDWELDVRPTRFLFENFNKILYEPDRLFGDLPTTFAEARAEEHALAKIRRRTRIQDAYEIGPARLHRRLCWLFYRVLERTDSTTKDLLKTRRIIASLTPRPIQRSMHNVLKHGKNPAFWKSYG